jgi:hypothetical protein
MKKISTAAQRQHRRFTRLVAVAQSAYLDGQGELATWVLQVAWMAAEDQSQIGNVVAGAQFMLDHPINGLDRVILRDLLDDTWMLPIALSA